jgi:hypothetical protein
MFELLLFAFIFANMRNKLAGKSTGKSKSAKYYAANPDSRKKKDEYNKEYHSTDKRKSYRTGLNRANRNAGTYGNGDGKDMSHTKSGRLVQESQSPNRARNGSGKRGRLKRG